MDMEKFRRKEHNKPSLKKTKKQNGRFIKGPIPYSWYTRACCLSSTAGVVAAAIYFLFGLNKEKNPIALSNIVLKDFGIDRRRKYEALKRLKEAGLIDVDNQPGRSPRIKIIF